jgi:hypothetical protein
VSKPRTDFGAILRTLVDSGVEFIVVGGVGAVLQGPPSRHSISTSCIHEAPIISIVLSEHWMRSMPAIGISQAEP